VTCSDPTGFHIQSNVTEIVPTVRPLVRAHLVLAREVRHTLLCVLDEVAATQEARELNERDKQEVDEQTSLIRDVEILGDILVDIKNVSNCLRRELGEIQ
jgi:hypothetical protein